MVLYANKKIVESKCALSIKTNQTKLIESFLVIFFLPIMEIAHTKITQFLNGKKKYHHKSEIL